LSTKHLEVCNARIQKPLHAGGLTRPTTIPTADDRERTATIDNIPDPDSLSLDAFWEAGWEKNLMSAALEQVKRQVSGKQFQIFDLYVLQNWPVRDVTRTLRVSAAQVYLAKHRVSAL